MKRTCLVCGKEFDALTAVYCGSTCRSRASRGGLSSKRRRQQLLTPPVVAFRPAPDPLAQWHVKFVDVLLGESLPDELLAALGSDEDCQDRCTAEEFAAVALRVARRFQTAIESDDYDCAEQLAQYLQALMEDRVSDRVVIHLAARIANTPNEH